MRACAIACHASRCARMSLSAVLSCSCSLKAHTIASLHRMLARVALRNPEANVVFQHACKMKLEGIVSKRALR